jgi:type I restriction enzyme M protein
MPVTATAVRTSFLPFGCNHAAVRKAMSAGIPLFQAFSPISVQGSTYCDCIKDGRKIDPCCGSGWMFVQSEEFVKEHQGKIDDLAVYGEESNPTTWKLAKMNLAIRGIDNDLGPHQGDTFANDMHKGTHFDYILANPPFNIKDWGGEKLKDDVRWKYGVPPESNANYAWMEHIISKLQPDGKAGFVLANGALSTSRKEELAIRKAVLEDDKIDAIVALPGQMFYSTQIPVSLWFIDMNKSSEDERDLKGETLFIDARQMGEMIDRTHKAFSDEDIKKIADTYHAYRGTNGQKYEDIPGFCKAANLDEIEKMITYLRQVVMWDFLKKRKMTKVTTRR